MSPAPAGTSPLHWAITVIVVAVITGGCAALGTWLGRRSDGKKAEARTQVSVDLHRQAFDGAVEDLDRKWSAQIRETVAPLAAKQDEIADTLHRVDGKLDRTVSRLDTLEVETYSAIDRANRVIRKHHPEDAA